MRRIRSILIGLVLIQLIIVAGAVTPIKSEVIWSEHEIFGFDYGDKIVKTYYDDGTDESQYIHAGSLLNSLIITSIPGTISVPRGSSSISIPVTFQGTSCMFTSDAYHFLEVSYDGKLIERTDYVVVVCNQLISTASNIPASQFGSIINIDGTYSIKAKERMVFADGSYVSGDTKYINLVVGTGVTSTPTPTQTTPIPTQTTPQPTQTTPVGTSPVGTTPNPPSDGGNEDDTPVLVTIGILLVSGLLLVMGRKKRR